MGITSASANADPIARATLMRMGDTSARSGMAPSAMRQNGVGGPTPVGVVAEGLTTGVERKFIHLPGEHAGPFSGFGERGDGDEAV